MIFVDTSFWVAAGMQSDSHHADAATLLAEHGDQSLVTTNHIRGETWTFPGAARVTEQQSTSSTASVAAPLCDW